MDVLEAVSRNARPERFSVHAQAKVTHSVSVQIGEFAKAHGVPRATAVRILIELGLDQFAETTR